MKRRAFTLIECIFAAIIVVFGLIIAARMLPQSRRYAAVSKNHNVALLVARNTLEEIRSVDYGMDLTTAGCLDRCGEIAGATSGGPSINGAPSIQMPDFIADNEMVEGNPTTTIFHRAVNFANGGLTAGVGTAAAPQNADICNVQVWWSEEKARAGEPDKSIVVSGGVSREP